MRTRTAIRIACGCALAAFVAAGGRPAGAAEPPAIPSPEELANARYVGILDDPVTLVDGEFAGEPAEPGAGSRTRVSLVPDFTLRGDLDGDGVDEVAVLLTASFGGSGTFLHLAAVGRRRDAVTALGSAPVGDRVQVRGGRIEGPEIVLEVVQSGPEDAACCPSQNVTRRFRIDGERLVEGEALSTGTASTADLAGVEWRLLRFSRAEPLPDDAGITLSFDGDRVSGRGGCNRYTAAVDSGGAPGELAFGPVGGTRMACPEPAMAREARYFEALAGTVGYGFVAGRLALSWLEDGELHSMLFARAD